VDGVSTTFKTVQIEPGTVIADRYEVVKRIGSGGMGMVFKVLDRHLSDEVLALKLLQPHLVEEETVFRRFLNEVRVARSLTHPNIVRIHDIGTAKEGFPYISMEFVEGVSLRDRILNSANRLSFSEALGILYQILNGVAYAHEKGVIHRDLKPANVLIGGNDAVKLVDFGTARIVGLDNSITQTGQSVGTPDYMSPEQIVGENIGSASDIYALGIIAYELIARQRPYVADTAVAVAFKHMSEPVPSLKEIEPSTPQWYDALITKAMAKSIEDRSKYRVFLS